MAARIIEVVDGALAAIVAKWAPADPDAATREAELPINENDFVNAGGSFTGRRVWFFPAGYSRIAPVSRGMYLNEYKVRAVTAEWFTDPGRVTNAWLDPRIEFVSQIVDWLDFAIDKAGIVDGLLLGSLWTETIDVEEAYMPDLLAQNKLFFSEVLFGFREES